MHLHNMQNPHGLAEPGVQLSLCFFELVNASACIAPQFMSAPITFVVPRGCWDVVFPVDALAAPLIDPAAMPGFPPPPASRLGAKPGASGAGMTTQNLDFHKNLSKNCYGTKLKRAFDCSQNPNTSFARALRHKVNRKDTFLISEGSMNWPGRTTEVITANPQSTNRRTPSHIPSSSSATMLELSTLGIN